MVDWVRIMQKIYALVTIVMILNMTVVVIAFSYLQNEINQIKTNLTPVSTPTQTLSPAPTQTTIPTPITIITPTPIPTTSASPTSMSTPPPVPDINTVVNITYSGNTYLVAYNGTIDTKNLSDGSYYGSPYITLNFINGSISSIEGLLSPPTSTTATWLIGLQYLPANVRLTYHVRIPNSLNYNTTILGEGILNPPS